MPRSGNEPANARSPLGLRLGLACFGLAFGVVGAVLAAFAGLIVWVFAFGVLAVVAAVDAFVVGRHIRAGAHFQPGPDVPAYEPVESPSRPRGGEHGREHGRVAPEVRRRRYLILMSICLTLIVLAWTVVRFFSTELAVAMSLVAMVIPPVAAIVANAGARPPE